MTDEEMEIAAMWSALVYKKWGRPFGLLLAAAIWALWVGYAHAMPFLVSGPVKYADDPKTPEDESTQTPEYAKITCRLQEGTGPVVITPLVDNGCKVDLANVASGPHTYEIWFHYSDPVWGEVPGLKAPFSFTRPAVSLGAPTTLRLDTK